MMAAKDHRVQLCNTPILRVSLWTLFFQRIGLACELYFSKKFMFSFENPIFSGGLFFWDISSNPLEKVVAKLYLKGK
jgi:hypothetical protein